MNEATQRFYQKHKDKLGANVLEIGSLNVNGCLRDVIDITVGVDIRKGKGVDLVCPVENLKSHFKDGYFDSCVSAGTLEHVKDWKSFVTVTWDLVKDGGWLVLTIASLKKGRHNYPNDYWRMTEDQIRSIYPNLEDYTPLSGSAVGWIVKKEGSLGSLDFEPIHVK